jgi:hypothetical protein
MYRTLLLSLTGLAATVMIVGTVAAAPTTGPMRPIGAEHGDVVRIKMCCPIPKAACKPASKRRFTCRVRARSSIDGCWRC